VQAGPNSPGRKIFPEFYALVRIILFHPGAFTFRRPESHLGQGFQNQILRLWLYGGAGYLVV